MKRLAALTLFALALPATALAQETLVEFEPEDITVPVPEPDVAIFIVRDNVDAEQELELDATFLDEIVPSPDASFL
jgi:hypothetical protein